MLTLDEDEYYPFAVREDTSDISYLKLSYTINDGYFNRVGLILKCPLCI